MKPASHVIPAWAGVLERNLWEAVQRREEPYRAGIRKHRFQALVQPSAGMTCFLLPVPALRWDDIAVEACNNLKNT